jgi:hypothetical protein
MDEIWKTISDYPNYAVSNFGNVRRVVGGAGARKGRILRAYTHKQRYRMVVLYANGMPKQFTVHGLVARAFLGLCPEDCEINHKDLNKSNNWYKNLEYVTHSKNVVHAIEHNSFGMAKLTWKSVRQARALWAKGKHTIAAIANLNGVSVSTMSYVLNGRTWVEV